MFAVPGWAVSASALAQEKPSIASTVHQNTASKKRKHPHALPDKASKVSGAELEKLWNQSHRAAAASATAAASAIQQGKPEAHQNRQARAQRHETGNGQEPAKVQKVERPKGSRSSLPQASPLLQEAPPKKKGRSGDAEVGRSPRAEANTKQRRGGGVQDDDEENNDGRQIARKGRHHQHSHEDRGTRHGPPEAAPAKPLAPSTSDLLASLPPVPPTTKLTPLQVKMRRKLTSARFRHLNETLYTSTSSSALDLFTASPDLFAEYHAGFSQQVKESWPQNPVDHYIASIKTRGAITEIKETKKGRILPLPRRKTGSCTVADLGCGDAPLARGCQSEVKRLHLKFHNFDLHAPNSLVTKADISNLPLRDGEADIAVFCLSLMGTNWVSFVEEAWRVVRGDGKGEVWVAEVKSRFGRPRRKVVENSVGKRRKNQKPKKVAGGSENDPNLENGLEDEVYLEDTEGTAADETDISAFVKVLARRGFQLKDESVDKSNKMFVSMVFVKSGIPTAGKHKGLKWTGKQYEKLHDGKMKFTDDNETSPAEEASVLKPCVYKPR